MPFSIDDSTNPADTHTNLNLIQSVNAIAFILKRITGESSWKVPPTKPLTELAISLKGDKGDKGDTGAQGIQGLKGDKGDTGATGVQGLKGDTGATGAQGIQGLKGDKGDTGATGATGAQGIQGLKGDKGDTGATGAAGADASVVPGAWQDITLITGWSNYATGYTSPQCRKLIGNLIEVKGTIKKATTPLANEVIATLPVGYRPTEIMMLTTWASNGYSRIQVEPNGSIKLIAGVAAGAGLNFLFGLN
ncbi:hypothetical protein NIES4075_25000 [Tolypothrix sp. NIES-4075]|uniref:collagen-like protein n=1 Tax=Tolypothrix sp. NIES-4075 TaxID=2005459 RepID=UPI000B5C5217|nr:collagen-like protein [Tolypothrix sp. NIES-4075]GAX41527.1 hypothetical protein NIES4075_25000 [Tolypothrix sp. NIES-4075]